MGVVLPTLGREGAATPLYVSSTAGGGFTLSLSTYMQGLNYSTNFHVYSYPGVQADIIKVGKAGPSQGGETNNMLQMQQDEG